MQPAIFFAAGVIFGALGVWLLLHSRRREAEDLARELVNQAEARKLQDLEALLGRIKESFNSLSLEALSRSQGELVRMAEEKLGQQTSRSEHDLESKRKLIDQNVDTMRGDLRRVQDLVSQLERDRQQKFGELAEQLRSAAEQTTKLQDTTEHLRQALASTKVRGQWGERMAEDVLQLAGFREGVNYLKQKVLESVGSRPDYTFLLPQSRTLNMDVKFPLDNYLRYLEAPGEADQERHKTQFLRDVRNRIKEVTTREYINPEENTLDYVLVFIPNEQVYAFINDSDRDLLDVAMKSKVILCSPITLYAILAVIRQGMANFNMERTASQLLGLVEGFEKQFAAFVDSFDRMGKKIEDAQTEFKKLESTRRKQLDRSLEKIRALREEKGLLSSPTMDAEATPVEVDSKTD